MGGTLTRSCAGSAPIIALAVSSSALVPSAVAKKRKAFSNSDVLVLAAAATDPSNLSSGSMTVAQGCTEFYDVVAGDICQSVANEFNITLDVFCESFSLGRRFSNDGGADPPAPRDRRHEPPSRLRVPEPGNLD